MIDQSARFLEEKQKRLGQLFDSIDDARRISLRAKKDSERAEREVEILLAKARRLMLTD